MKFIRDFLQTQRTVKISCCLKITSLEALHIPDCLGQRGDQIRISHVLVCIRGERE